MAKTCTVRQLPVPIKQVPYPRNKKLLQTLRQQPFVGTSMTEIPFLDMKFKLQERSNSVANEVNTSGVKIKKKESMRYVDRSMKCHDLTKYQNERIN